MLVRRNAPVLNLVPPGLKSSVLISSKCLEIFHQIQKYCKYMAETGHVFPRNILTITQTFLHWTRGFELLSGAV